MGRGDQQHTPPQTPADENLPQPEHGMGVSSEHDDGHVQEVDSREQE